MQDYRLILKDWLNAPQTLSQKRLAIELQLSESMLSRVLKLERHIPPEALDRLWNLPETETIKRTNFAPFMKSYIALNLPSDTVAQLMSQAIFLDQTPHEVTHRSS